MKWAGKKFRSTEDVDPIMVYDEDEKRIWNPDWGHARVSSFNFDLASHVDHCPVRADHFACFSFVKLNGMAKFQLQWFMMMFRSLITSDTSGTTCLLARWMRRPHLVAFTFFTFISEHLGTLNVAWINCQIVEELSTWFGQLQPWRALPEVVSVFSLASIC